MGSSSMQLGFPVGFTSLYTVLLNWSLWTFSMWKVWEGSKLSVINTYYAKYLLLNLTQEALKQKALSFVT
jgi:hypothetical protein